MAVNVSIIIINYNTLELTKCCIDSIFRNTFEVTFEVILVDNASTDGSREFFQNDTRIRYFYSDKNLGFGCGNNLGYKYASGSYVFLLNSDTKLINNAVYELYSFMESHPEYAICGGALYDAEYNQCHSYGMSLPSLKGEFNMLFRGLIECGKKKMIEDNLLRNGYSSVGYVTGADMMIRSEIIDELGLFDPDFFMYYEETELSYRYASKGYLSAYYPKAKIHHYEGKSFSFKETKEKMFLSSKKLYYVKTGKSDLYYFCCNLVYLCYILTSILKDICKGNFSLVRNSWRKVRLIIKETMR